MSKTTKKQQKNDDILSSVMSSIENDEVKMKSKMFFIGLSIILFVSTFLMVIAISAVLHTIWNDIDVARAARVLEFGSPGRAFVLRNAPWILVLTLAIMFTTLYYLINKFEISHKYRHTAPLMLIAGVIFSGTVLSVSGVNEKLSDSTLGRFKSIEEALDDSYITGEIQEIEDGYLIIGTEEEEYKVKMPYKNKIRDKLPDLILQGREVKIFGEYEGDEFEAYGVVTPEFERKVKSLKHRKNGNIGDFEIIPIE